MKHTLSSRALVIAIAAFAGVAISVAAALQEGVDTSSSPPAETVEALHRALGDGDRVAVKQLLDSSVLIFEGGNVERSLVEYDAHHLPADLEFMTSVDYQQDRQTGHAEGDLAWVASEGRLISKGADPERISTETVVLRRSAGKWKIVHIHWSSRQSRGRA